MGYLGEIRIFAGNFAPKGWAFCDGQLMPIMQNTALFSLLGTNYGGDGKTTFALPNLVGRVPIQAGMGNGLTDRTLGVSGGSAAVELNSGQLPVHNHTPVYKEGGMRKDHPAGAVWAKPGGRVPAASYSSYGPNRTATMEQGAVRPAGGSQPHNNMQPFLALNFIICTSGDFPPRS
ncbi:tail Collar domain-containing protein [Paenibacillus albidus]|uniref:Tail Collar domain-containing protein n=1 Tax=Paenibacillus albidus TaxID=2041023 RepID=A0A917CXR3_9BACL|nr:tail fiber protein [Paenibacillus albidus]GGG00725.1 tail Collar domain-containing protein [Paenibacillus albidus]